MPEQKDDRPVILNRALPIEEKVTTTITLPKQTADEVKEAARRAGIGWTQMMMVLIRQALDAGPRNG